MNDQTPTKPRPSVKQVLRLIRQAGPETMQDVHVRQASGLATVEIPPLKIALDA